MLAADLQTMPHCRRQARLITVQTFGDAILHIIVDQMHRVAPFTNLCPYLTGREILETTVCRFGSGGCPVKGSEDNYGQGTVNEFTPIWYGTIQFVLRLQIELRVLTKRGLDAHAASLDLPSRLIACSSGRSQSQ